jgi:hypothetical protein
VARGYLLELSCAQAQTPGSFVAAGALLRGGASEGGGDVGRQRSLGVNGVFRQGGSGSAAVQRSTWRFQREARGGGGVVARLHGGSAVRWPCARWRETRKSMWRWVRRGWRQQLSSGQSEPGAGAVGASSELRRALAKGKAFGRSGKEKKGGRGREGGVRRAAERRGHRAPGAAAARDRRSVRTGRRGDGRRASREKAEEREGEVAVGWDRPDGGTRWQREKEDGAAAGGQPGGGAQS